MVNRKIIHEQMENKYNGTSLSDCQEIIDEETVDYWKISLYWLCDSIQGLL